MEKVKIKVRMFRTINEIAYTEIEVPVNMGLDEFLETEEGTKFEEKLWDNIYNHISESDVVEQSIKEVV